MKRTIIVFLAIGLILALGTVAMATNQAPGTGITRTSHDLSSITGVGDSWGSGSAADGTMDRICIYCHTPHHSATAVDATAKGLTYYPLWNHDTTVLTYETYTNGLDTPDGIQHSLNAAPLGQPGSVSKLCLSCHDGSVAISSYGNYEGGANSESHTGAVNASGRILVGGSVFGLTNHHPIGFVYADVQAADDEINDVTTPFTNNPFGITIEEVLWKGKMECSSCHDVHNTKNSGSKFTWTEDTNSQLCLTCHYK